MILINVERLHENVKMIDNPTYFRRRGSGITTAYLHLLLGEAQLGDPRNCYVYVGPSYDKALQVRDDFRRLLWNTEQMESHLRDDKHVYVVDSDQDFFFVDRSYFGLKFSFAGTLIHRVYVDIDSRMVDSSILTKVDLLEHHDAEIL